jgi:hypothetical protein
LALILRDCGKPQKFYRDNQQPGQHSNWDSPNTDSEISPLELTCLVLFLYEYVIRVVPKQLLVFKPLQLSDSGCPKRHGDINFA